ncbi:MAG TPA: hypothetical protein VF677_15400 [Flavobacterium sp.]|jgi:hypothetical protein
MKKKTPKAPKPPKKLERVNRTASERTTSAKPPQIKEIQIIAAKLKKIRIEKGYTSYEAFTYAYELPRTLYGKYEKGQDMRISSLVKILNIVGVPLSEFFNEDFD